ncbi:MAG: CDC48 family AAA ATPase [Candidatus Poseidoniia archaeon]|nr:CDC48 family AAA ATPase [Candidatus Poseidoniia archaeon]
MGEDSITLKVAEALQDEVGYGRGRLDTVTRNELGLSIGDIVEIHGRRRDPTVAIVWRARTEDEGKGIVRVDGLIRNNAKVNLGDKVAVKKAQVKPAKKVVLAPMMDQSGRVQFGPGIEEVILRGLNRRPLTKGDVVIVPGLTLMGGRLPFAVTVVQPKGIIQIQADTVIQVHEDPVKEEELTATGVAYEDIGGLKEEIKKVREMIELPLKHPELFDALGIDPPKGVLLYGPPGTGKTLLAKAVANESGANFLSIQGPEIMNKYYGESEAHLRQIFEEAETNSPSIIFIDELDSIASKRDETQGEVERRVVAQLLTLMDGLQGRGQVIVIAATNRPDAIDQALRRPGRFDREIEIGIPDRDGRKQVLQVHTRGMPISRDKDGHWKKIDHFAEITHGFVGADLAALAREAAMSALRRYLPEIDLDEPIPPKLLQEMKVTNDDFKEALKDVEPSALREIMVEIPKVKWDEVGGLEDVKQQLKETVEWPLTNPEGFERLGIKPPRGLLLYGPPGNGKTLIAKAIATESAANFIAIKGPEVMSKWVGESEKKLREVFRKAKQVSPCIVFLDELDALAPTRGTGGDNNVSDRLVDQLLTSMDGLENMEGVITIGATNRPEVIDSALLRPGRFDRMILVGEPDEDARKKILKIHTKSVPLKNVKLGVLAKKMVGYTGADIEGVVREAAILALRKDHKAKEVTMKHFEDALELVVPSITEDTVKYYEEIGKRLRRSRRGERRSEADLYI